jgi:CRISPR-associated protein Csd1
MTMLLEKLSEYADRLDLPPTMYLKTPIRWLIDLDQEGNFLGFVRTEGKGGKNDRGKEFLAPHIARSSGVKAKLLADNGEYVLRRARQESKPERVEECHRQFVVLVRQCAEATREPIVIAIQQFLEQLHTFFLSLPEDFDPGHVLTFRVDGIMPIDLPSVRQFWASMTTEAQ